MPPGREGRKRRGAACGSRRQHDNAHSFRSRSRWPRQRRRQGRLVALKRAALPHSDPDLRLRSCPGFRQFGLTLACSLLPRPEDAWSRHGCSAAGALRDPGRLREGCPPAQPERVKTVVRPARNFLTALFERQSLVSDPAIRTDVPAGGRLLAEPFAVSADRTVVCPYRSRSICPCQIAGLRSWPNTPILEQVLTNTARKSDPIRGKWKRPSRAKKARQWRTSAVHSVPLNSLPCEI